VTELSAPLAAESAALESALESLLLVVDAPAPVALLAEAAQADPSEVQAALRRMAEALDLRGSGFDLRESREGWRLYTRARHAHAVERLLLGGARSKLTRAALETLAVIAYQQPVARGKIASVRGVNVDGVVRTLLARGLIREAGQDADSTATAYATTELFLERLGLTSLGELPDLAPLLPEVEEIDEMTDEARERRGRLPDML
jgi:segregation and condensation protein B